MENEEKLELLQFEELIQGLMDRHYGCCNDFILPATINGLRDISTGLNSSGNMKLSGIGNSKTKNHNLEIRCDKINWIEKESSNAFELVYLNKIAKFILHLNKTCYTAIKSFESHYSIFEKQSFYKRHLDQFKNEKGRQFSIVLYLNYNWKEEDGGALTLYPKDSEQTNISPLGGRLVFFRSDEMEHEVQVSTTRARSSIACWLKN